LVQIANELFSVICEQFRERINSFTNQILLLVSREGMDNSSKVKFFKNKNTVIKYRYLRNVELEYNNKVEICCYHSVWKWCVCKAGQGLPYARD